MVSQRWHVGEHEAVSCRSKLKYDSALAAGKAKDAMRRRKHISPAKDALNVYRCRYCDGWHLGRPRRKRTLKNRAAVRVAQQAETHAE